MAVLLFIPTQVIISNGGRHCRRRLCMSRLCIPQGYVYRRATLLCPNHLYPYPYPYPIITRTTTLPNSSLILLQPFSSSKEHSFTVNYLINNCGFSPETASKLSHRVHLDNSERPDSVLSFFRTHGFSNTQVSGIIRTYPVLLVSDPNKTILPKLNFLLSKGASISDLAQIVTKNPRFLRLSLKNSMTPCYDLVKRFLLSDESTVLSIKSCPGIICSKTPAQNIQVLLENGVPESKVAFMLSNWSYTVTANPDIFKKAVEEVKELGFNPNSVVFIVAVRAKIMRKSLWERKIDLYKKWGWSEDIIVSAFVRYPWCMLASVDKIEAMMQFLVNNMGWESLMLAKHPILILMSLEKRVIPRSFVLQFLHSKGLIKDAKSAAPFKISEDMFLKTFVNCFEEEASQLLKLYEEKRSGLPR